MSVRDCYCAAEGEVPDNDAEAIWVEVSLRNKHKLFIGSYYRSSSGNASNQLDELEKKLYHISNKTKNNPNHTMMLGGDFNLGDIQWDSEIIDP